MSHASPLPSDRKTGHVRSGDMPRSLVWLFALASGLSVANVYYAQPLLDALSRDFGISQGAIGGVVTATQIGCALALLFVVPLGDKVDRRRLMALQLVVLVAALVTVGMAQTSTMLLAGMLATGLAGTAMTQGLIAYAANAASPHEQGRVIGAAQGGVFMGLLVARVVSGGISDIAGWRGVYLSAAGLMVIIAFPLWWRLPRLPAVPETNELSAPDSLNADPAAGRKSPAGARHTGFTDVRGVQYFLERSGAAVKCPTL